jgi:hypothetical protein
MKLFRLSAMLACLAAAAAGETRKEYRPISILLSHETGSIVSGIAEAETLDGAWIQRTGAWLGYEAVMDGRLTVRAGLGGIFWYSMPEYRSTVDAQTRYFSPNLNTAHGVYAFGDPAQPHWELTAGYFPLKYNPQARNLGEYLFRAGAYPGYISTGGLVITKSSRANLLGLRLSGELPVRVTHDLVIHSATELPPLYDFSLSYLAGYRAGGVLEVGAGIQLEHFLPVKPSYLSPRRPSNGYFEEGARTYVGNPSYYAVRGDTAAAALVAARIADTVNPPDYSYYTFKAVKLMARASFDPKPFFASGALGGQDLRLYAEAAVLGVKDYPVYYERLAERIPFMVGFNLPAFKLLDVLAVEVERYASPYLNSYEIVKLENFPIPYVGTRSQADPETDDLKWTVYGERTVLDGLSLIGQVARDHLRTIQYPGKIDPSEAIRERGHWHWVARLELKI